MKGGSDHTGQHFSMFVRCFFLSDDSKSKGLSGFYQQKWSFNFLFDLLGKVRSAQ